MRHGSLASTETNVSLTTALNLGDDELAKSAQEGHVEVRRQRQLSTVGEEQSMRTRESSVSCITLFRRLVQIQADSARHTNIERSAIRSRS